MELVSAVEYSKIIKAVFGNDEYNGRERIRKRKERMALKSLNYQHLDWDDDSGAGEVDLYVL